MYREFSRAVNKDMGAVLWALPLSNIAILSKAKDTTLFRSGSQRHLAKLAMKSRTIHSDSVVPKSIGRDKISRL